MWETLADSEGIGLAAPQIGKSIRLVLIDLDPLSEDFPEYKDFKRVYINAHIIEVDEEDTSRLRLKFPPSPRSGSYPVQADGVGKTYYANKVDELTSGQVNKLNDSETNNSSTDKTVFRNASFTIERGQKVAFVGRNGEGKSTMVKCIMGQLEHEGTLTLGHNVQIGYFAQNGYKYNSNQKVLEFMQEDCDYNVSEIRSVLASMGFTQNDIGKSLSVLSGGEIMKLLLAKMLMGRYNILLMDEPSNFLDIPSLDALEILMKEYAGTIVFITHDKRLLDNVADVIYEIKDKKLNLVR